mmetsp:Transcript_18476/g.21258  ORF Transcript_18476/g.21258 Transcript_18476/m.21258 type:complete len:361 (+) Transcript_18476:24-1106(+)
MTQHIVTRQVKQKPVAVILGWLGSTRNSFRRYEKMYESFGWEVLTVIPPTSAVVDCATPLLNDNFYSYRFYKNDRNVNGQDLPGDDSAANHLHPNPVMRNISIETLTEVDQRNCPAFICHVFSNAGCFLYEEIQHVLRLDRSAADAMKEEKGNQERNVGRNLFFKEEFKNTSERITTITSLSDLNGKLRGVIFDSSPAFYIPGEKEFYHLSKVMKYAEEPFRSKFFKAVDELKVSEQLNPKMYDERLNLETRRFSQFWNGMKTDVSENQPQLYLYSNDDSDLLTNSNALRDLISHRLQSSGEKKGSFIQSVPFYKSQHCAHLLHHTKRYEDAVQNFLISCYPFSCDERPAGSGYHRTSYL